MLMLEMANRRIAVRLRVAKVRQPHILCLFRPVTRKDFARLRRTQLSAGLERVFGGPHDDDRLAQKRAAALPPLGSTLLPPDPALAAATPEPGSGTI